ncbi:MAG: hypothetical protein ACT6T0_06805 [Nevskia sp.]|uniref:hypothetical protein n=1 Tax=Nevskia sp. TaxID=1929292 RepID=UPI0040363DFE
MRAAGLIASVTAPAGNLRESATATTVVGNSRRRWSQDCAGTGTGTGTTGWACSSPAATCRSMTLPSSIRLKAWTLQVR